MITKSIAHSVLILLATLGLVQAQSTAFTYQGRLDDGVNPASGRYDLRFALFDDNNGGVPLGGWLTNAATSVSNGLFTVTLDFGHQFSGANRWLELGVRTNGGTTFTMLTPRQPLTATPYAVQASSASVAGFVTGAVPTTQITGTLPLAQLPATVVTNGASGVNLSGTFTGNGAGVTNVNLAANSGGAIALSGNFVLASLPALGFGPYAVEAADVNGDGRPDLISANGNASSLMVLTNSGAGGFVPASSPNVGSGPQGFTSADVNGDGWVDLISANNFDDTLTVLTNDGSGGFAVSSTPAVGHKPTAVETADVNGDGRLDLISANFDSETLTVLTNSVAGGFGFASSPNAGRSPLSVTSADVNGDAWPDLVCANFHTNTLTVLTNNGRGGFVLASSPVVGLGPFSITSADVNGDGKIDLISANLHASTLTVLTNLGGGGFALSSSPPAGQQTTSITSVDVNGDGRPDLISASFDDNRLTVVTNDGRSGFGLASLLNVGPRPYSVTSADVNGDGRPDLISANYGGASLSVLFNSATFSGGFVGDGSGLTSLNAGHLTGAVPPANLTLVPAASLTGSIADARLSANVAMRAGGNTFTGPQNIDGPVGIGLSSPSYPLEVQAAQSVGRFTTTNSGNGSVLVLQNATEAPNYLGAINFDTESGTPGQIGYYASNALVFRVGGAERMMLDASGLTVNGRPALLAGASNQPVEFVPNSASAWRLLPNTNSPNIIGGYAGNVVSNGVVGAFIGGGGSEQYPNQVTANYGAVLSGFGNVAAGVNSTAFGNQSQAYGADSTVFGSRCVAANNYAVAMGEATLAGGASSTAMGYFTAAMGSASTAMGWNSRASGDYSTAMGRGTLASGDYSTAMGWISSATGLVSTAMGAGTMARGDISTAMGDFTTASGFASTAMGTVTLASGPASTAMGSSTKATNYCATALGLETLAGGSASTAMGYRARALHHGSFVWADQQAADFDSTLTNQFNIRASSGVRLANDTSLNFGNQTRQMLNLWSTGYGIGVQTSAQYFRSGAEFMWYAGGSHSDAFGDPGPGGSQLMRLGSTGNLILAGTLSQSSDRNVKEDFAAVDAQEVLAKVAALPIQSWSYTNQPGVKHVGPVAQDFHAAFGLNGGDDKHIATVDADGVALAAIQGLNRKLEVKEAEIADLKQRLSTLERMIFNRKPNEP